MFQYPHFIIPISISILIQLQQEKRHIFQIIFLHEMKAFQQRKTSYDNKRTVSY